MTDFASGFEIKIPQAAGRDVFLIGNKFIAKGELKLAASAHLPNASGAVGGVTTNSVIEINRESVISAGRSIEVAIAERVKAGFSAGINFSELDNVIEQIVTDGECRASHFSPLVSGLNASIGFGNTSLSLGWDSDLCFVSIKGSLPLKIGNETIVLEATFQLGLHEYMWWILFNKVAARYPNTSRYILKIESILGSMFGGRTLRMATFLRGAFAGMHQLAPFMWAIDIALAVRDLTVWLVRREQIAGHRAGLINAFSTSFTRTICDYYPRINPPRAHWEEPSYALQAGSTGELQEFGIRLSNIYQGSSRIAVQRYLALFHNNARSIDNVEEAQVVGDRFGYAMDSLPNLNANPQRRPSNTRTIAPVIGSFAEAHPGLTRHINNYFTRNIEPWVSDWET